MGSIFTNKTKNPQDSTSTYHHMLIARQEPNKYEKEKQEPEDIIYYVGEENHHDNKDVEELHFNCQYLPLLSLFIR